MFEVHVERRTWIIKEGGATIELVLDRGEVVAGDRQSPICEVELFPVLSLLAGKPNRCQSARRRRVQTCPHNAGDGRKGRRV